MIYWKLANELLVIIHQNFRNDHSALAEQRRQRRRQERRENEDEEKTRVLAKGQAEVLWGDLACATGKDLFPRILETSSCVSCSATRPSPAAWSSRPTRPRSPSPPWRGRAGGGTTRRAGQLCGGCKVGELFGHLVGIGSRGGTWGRVIEM